MADIENANQETQEPAPTPPPVNETTVHPDDSFVMSALSLHWSEPGTSDTGTHDPLLRVDKEISASGADSRGDSSGDSGEDGGPRTGPGHTRYTYASSRNDARKVYVTVPHGPPPVEIAVEIDGELRTLQFRDSRNLTKARRPQVWYTYGLDGSDLTVQIHRFL